jgi:serine protease Do
MTMQLSLTRHSAPGTAIGRPWSRGAGLALPLLAGVLLWGSAANALVPESFAPIVEQVAPAVVNISATGAARQGPRAQMMPPPFDLPPGSPFGELFRRFMQPEGQLPAPPPRPATSLGSGFIVDATGYVVTNNHVVEGAEEVIITLNDERRLTATVVGNDPSTDIALLKVETSEPLPTVAWGDSDAIRVGDWVVAVGNPFGLGGTVTVGVLSARGRDIQSGPFDDFMQIDASINRGNSGGPTFDTEGRVIGINTAIFSPTGGNVGIGFAIPSNLARDVIDQLRETGEVRRGWLGVRIQVVTPEIAEALGLDDASGALVADVTPGSPAAEAGLRQGDVILRFRGQTVDQMRALPRFVASAPIGEPADVEILRDGERQTVTVDIGRLATEEAPVAEVAPPVAPETLLGAEVAALSPELRGRFDLDDAVQGVVVVRIVGDGPALERGLRAGDVIQRVGTTEVRSPSELADALDAARDADQASALILVHREGSSLFVGIPLVG